MFGEAFLDEFEDFDEYVYHNDGEAYSCDVFCGEVVRYVRCVGVNLGCVVGYSRRSPCDVD